MLPKVFNPPPDIKKKEFPKTFVLILFIVLLIIGLGYFLFYSNFFRIKNIQIDSTLPAEAATILDQAKGQNIFFVNLKQIKTDLQNKSPELQEIKFTRGLPDTLKISAEEFSGKITWQSQGHTYLVNASGLAFKEIDGPTDLAKVIDSKDLAVSKEKPVTSNNFIEFINTVYNKFTQEIGFKIIYFEINETIFQVDASTDQGWFIKFDTTRSPNDQIAQVKELLAKDKTGVHEYIDVRVEGRVYYK